jgi:glycosyltransferase involved in cell wall biosynthesis
MKIGIVGPIWIQIPPRKYGGTEEVVYNLTEGLVKKRHEVTLFGPKTARVSAHLEGTIDKPLVDLGIGWSDQSAFNYNLHHYLTAFRHAAEYDIMHVHLNKIHDNPALVFALHSQTPVLFTFHYPAPTEVYRPEKYNFLAEFPRFPYTSISDAARSGNDWNFIATVYNSIDIERFPFSEKSEDYFAWLGKIIPIKGLKEAILVAKQAGVKLKIMGAIDVKNPISVRYYEQEIKPLIDGEQIEFLGEADMNMKIQIFSKAKAFINPIQWPEPFGLVMAEAQAVGTPVIVLNKGAAGELVKDGKTGFVVENVEEMLESIKHLDRIRRIDCRKWAEEMFAPKKMVEGYEVAYKHTVEHWETYRSKQRKLLGI